MNTVQVTAITVYPIAVPFKAPIRTAYGELQSRHALILELKTNDGIRIFSECSALEDPGYHPETLASSRSCLESVLIPNVLNRPLDPTVLADDLLQLAPENPFAVAAIEMGVWEVLRQAQGTSLLELLEEGSVAAGFVLGRQTPNELRSQIHEAAKLNVHKLKLKVGPESLETVLELLVTEKAFDRFPYVALDGNRSFSKADTSLLKRLDKLPFTYLEEPFMDAERPPFRLRVPVLWDESIQRLSDLELALASPDCGGVIIKPGKFGGIQPSLNAAALCHKHGKMAVLGGMFETGIGRLYGLAVAAMMAPHRIPSDLGPSSRYFNADSTAMVELDPNGYFLSPSPQSLSDDSYWRSFGLT